MATSACSSSSLKKKFLSPGRRSIAPTGRLAGPDRWQAPFFIYLCCVSESEPSNASTCHLPGRRDSAFFGLFSAQKSGPSARTALIVFSGFGHKKCAKKRFVPRRGQSTRRGQIIQAQKGQGWDIFEVGAEIVSSSVTYHNGSRGRTHPTTTGLT